MTIQNIKNSIDGIEVLNIKLQELRIKRNNLNYLIKSIKKIRDTLKEVKKLKNDESTKKI